jgi:hypothetical protein
MLTPHFLSAWSWVANGICSVWYLDETWKNGVYQSEVSATRLPLPKPWWKSKASHELLDVPDIVPQKCGPVRWVFTPQQGHGLGPGSGGFSASRGPDMVSWPNLGRDQQSQSRNLRPKPWFCTRVVRFLYTPNVFRCVKPPHAKLVFRIQKRRFWSQRRMPPSKLENLPGGSKLWWPIICNSSWPKLPSGKCSQFDIENHHF